ncbi:unnamed protein product [Brassica oleracea]
MRINSPLRLCHVCGPLVDPAHLLSVNFKTHALKGRVVDTENGMSRSVKETERKRKALEIEGYCISSLRVRIVRGRVVQNLGATVVIKFHTGYKSRSKWLKTVTHDLGEFESIFLPRSTQFPDLEKTFDVCIIL